MLLLSALIHYTSDAIVLTVQVIMELLMKLISVDDQCDYFGLIGFLVVE